MRVKTRNEFRAKTFGTERQGDTVLPSNEYHVLRYISKRFRKIYNEGGMYMWNTFLFYKFRNWSEQRKGFVMKKF